MKLKIIVYLAIVFTYTQHIIPSTFSKDPDAHAQNNLGREKSLSGCDLCGEDEPSTTQTCPDAPTFIERIKNLFNDAIDQYTGEWQIERFLVLVGLKRPYEVLCQAHDNNELTSMLEILNDAANQEGDRLVQAAINTAVADKQESIVRRLIDALPPKFMKALNPKTIETATTYLRCVARQKRTCLTQELQEAMDDFDSLAKITRKLHQQPHPKLDEEEQETFAIKTAHNVVTFATRELDLSTPPT